MVIYFILRWVSGRYYSMSQAFKTEAEAKQYAMSHWGPPKNSLRVEWYVETLILDE